MSRPGQINRSRKRFVGEKIGGLTLTVVDGEVIMVGHDILIQLAGSVRGCASLTIQAPPEVRVLREKIVR